MAIQLLADPLVMRRTKKSQKSEPISLCIELPSKTYDRFWLFARRFPGTPVYPEATERCGKWMLFIPIARIDDVWFTIGKAVEDKKLGSSAKVATMKPNPNTVKPDEKVICIYTYDSEDREDVERVLVSLRNLGIRDRAFYKEDAVTIAGEYSRNSGRPVSKYWAKEGSTILLETRR
jgi:hypothetical protein